MGTIAFFGCQNKTSQPITNTLASENIASLELSIEQANKILELPLGCIELEYPNKLGQVLDSDADLKSPKQLRPIFYGCFDWHSSVHGFWSIVTLLQQFPEIDQDGSIRQRLNEIITPENLQVEMAFFQQPYNKNFERTYGWGWFLQLHQSLAKWEDKDAQRWSATLKPLADLFVEKYIEYLPKVNYPIRTGTHDNTAFGLSLALEYAKQMDLKDFEQVLLYTAKRLYSKDVDCNLAYEPSGHDFLSPCLQEAKLMSEVLSSEEYPVWLKQFLPGIFTPEFTIEVAKVSDRTDGHLVHLDGLNFSRANALFVIAKKVPSIAPNLTILGQKSFQSAFGNISGDDYMGSHWLGTFALYTLVNQ
ncbi:DUF2891 domain-containing protein [Myroides sp. LJL115]